MSEPPATEVGPGHEPPLVSVVVTTRNSIRTIATCLRSIRAQSYPALEVIVVDNGSVDGTWEVVQGLAGLALRGGPERSAQRNLGVERATGAFVLWIDADMELRPEVVERSVETARRENADGVVVPEVSEGQGFWARCRTLERRCYRDEPMVAAPRLVRRSYLRSSGGFAEWLSGTEDAELRMRMRRDGIRVVGTDAVIVHHEGRLSLFGVARKRFYYGRGLRSYRRAHPGAVSGQARATVRAYARNWRLLAAHPLTAAGLVILRATEAAAYVAGAAAGATRPR